ncbi:serine/threonine-protein kinase SCH9 [Lodderomyces elongisporus NRRL YB-4239]|uniref:Serine/threonine-protein kinase SCH9 n=1 Tax=Lodderomyces elongisporus (strain ATCC 11503 / CBS 2605 / JCM 1781 / NBRC 1676 / NRRL YB-4239) TaxID=379508 RepID=A5DV85_LODEL|nr:serine/threonine-protein kinase SCH9 [Lodderomyces elongisporus NRRL YB-4239]
MVDFAKSIFGFGNSQKREASSSPTPTPSISSNTNQSIHLQNHNKHHSNDNYNTSSATTHHQESNLRSLQQQQQQQQQQSYQHTEYSSCNPQYSDLQQQQQQQQQQPKFLPKRLVNVAPATTLSNNSSVYGTTTSTNTTNNPEAYLNQTFGNSDFQLQQQQQQHLNNYGTNNSSTADQKLGNRQNETSASASTSSLAPPAPTSTSASATAQSQSQSQNPKIITTDETGQTLNSGSFNSQPKGRLKVTIIEATDIQASQPYAVCTFESSEFVTNGPDSFGKSPMNSSASGSGAGSHPKNMYNANHGPMRALPVKHNQNQRPSLYQRQMSTPHLNLSGETTNPIWNHEATFDVVGSKSELDISVYDAARDDAFLGHVRIFPSTIKNRKSPAEWYKLGARIVGERVSSGSIQIKWEYQSLDRKRAYGPDDFEFLRLLGKGTFGQVFQVKKKDTSRIYAMKILSKKVIVKKKEIAHTIGERNILVRTSAAASPFIVGLKFSFQTPTDLFLVTDYMSGGELFWHLQKDGRFSEERAKFYIAELILALEHLHDNDIVYRDLKPENILLDANGHIALCDFGLSKANLNNDGTTNTFCGTTEYLAPEILLDESGYTKMVDFWSLGVLIFEMCCGWSPFYADNTQQMYKNIAFGKVRFPKEVLSPEGRSFVKGLLNRNPRHRLGATNDARELRAHPFFADIDWDLLRSKSIPPPFKPHLASETDTSNFDPEFTSESTSVLKKQMEMASTPLSPGVQANFKGFTYVDDSAMDDHFGRSYRMNTFRHTGSFIPGDPNLPPAEDAVDDDQIDEEDENMDVDGGNGSGVGGGRGERGAEDEEEDHQMDYEFVNGRFDL